MKEQACTREASSGLTIAQPSGGQVDALLT